MSPWARQYGAIERWLVWRGYAVPTNVHARREWLAGWTGWLALMGMRVIRQIHPVLNNDELVRAQGGEE